MRRYPLGVLLFQQLSKSFFLGIGCICFLCFSYFGKIWVLHSFFGCDSLVMVNNEHLIQQIQGLAVRNRLVFISNLFLKRLFLVLTQYTLKLLAELDVIFTQILVQILCSEHAVNLFKLVKIIIALEKWVSVEQQSSKEAA